MPHPFITAHLLVPGREPENICPLNDEPVVTLVKGLRQKISGDGVSLYAPNSGHVVTDQIFDGTAESTL